ncbi:NRDE-2, necessary for RNA interference-domain-containing protein [Mycotypha africana]|uniref:NRDE-2, necessary for RNA interference-domain-containing protein n=1 Tax=Mycotypha africana TaxID=64632 RepID=UPI00230141D9|nr:NRDE-2, necessary for RNA interference-domain-containing protein [Mycotypha africana]KAI8968975.1 NRDE-2, necessary for RNA interference-domain-containing protein [Mycotypha africana]
MNNTENSHFKKNLPKSIPPPPSFDSAPSFSTGSISIPSFSSAPDISSTVIPHQRQDRKQNDIGRKREDTKSNDRTSRKHRESSIQRNEDDYRGSDHRRRHRRSYSPSHHRSDHRHSRSSPNSRHSQKKRSKSPSHRHRISSKRRSESSRDKDAKRRRRSSSLSSSSSEESEVHTGTLDTGISFVMDTSGDPDNLVYGKNHAYSVPSFHRARRGRILGLPPNIRIDPTQPPKSGEIAIIDLSENKRSATSNYAWKELDKDFKRIRIRPKKEDKDLFAEHANVINLEDTDSQKSSKVRQEHQLIDYDLYDTGVDYRSIEGNKVKPSAQSSEEAGEEEDEEGESFNEYIRRRTIEFNRQLDREPENVQLWLDFIRFQDEAVRGLDSNIFEKSTTSSNSSKRASLNEVKLSIFEKALEHNPESEQLILAYLECGAETWETLPLLQMWDKYLKRLPDSIQLWSSYINLRQTNFASFTFTQCVNVFEDALSILMRQAKKTEEVDRRADIESLMVYILLRACLFMKQCGYQERAFSVIQASIEFNLYQPSIYKTITHEHAEKVSAFVEFWDSEVLRFGEKGAQGWHEYYRAVNNDDQIPEPNIDMNDNNTNIEDEEDEFINLRDWLVAETNNESNRRLPLRMVQADDELLGTDPFRVPLSDDVKNFLFDVTTAEARQSLIYSVLVFLGLPYTPPEIGSNTHFFTDTFTRNDISLDHFWPVKNHSLEQIVWYVAGVPMRSENTVQQTNTYDIPSSYPVGISEMFAKYGEWFRCSGRENIRYEEDIKFTREVFQQLLVVENSDHLRICYLAFEASCGHKLGRKLAKKLLKEHSTNLALWNAYACMEKGYGRIEEARKVYLAAIAMSHKQESQQLYIPLLYYMLARLEFDSNRPHEALKVLTSISGDQAYDANSPPVTVPVVLRTKEVRSFENQGASLHFYDADFFFGGAKYFLQKLAHVSTIAVNYAEREAAINFTRCYALFEYLSGGLDSACLIYEHALKYLVESKAEKGYESEMIWIDYATLVYQHARNVTIKSGNSGDDLYKPSRLRQLMERALALFPNNTIFLSFYIWNESRTKIYNRVQQLLSNALHRDSNIVLYLSAIFSELHRYKPYQVNSVRDLFERSVEDSKTRASVVLWKLYIQFEMLQNNKERAKTLFYRAVRECPWSKELYLQGIELFESTMDTRETNELVNVMMEKEIRIRIPIDEHLLE